MTERGLEAIRERVASEYTLDSVVKFRWPLAQAIADVEALLREVTRLRAMRPPTPSEPTTAAPTLQHFAIFSPHIDEQIGCITAATQAEAQAEVDDGDGATAQPVAEADCVTCRELGRTPSADPSSIAGAGAREPSASVAGAHEPECENLRPFPGTSPAACSCAEVRASVADEPGQKITDSTENNRPEELLPASLADVMRRNARAGLGRMREDGLRWTPPTEPPRDETVCNECGHEESFHRPQIDGGTCGAVCSDAERCACRNPPGSARWLPRDETAGECGECDGSGETWLGSDWSGAKDCDICGGTGRAVKR